MVRLEKERQRAMLYRSKGLSYREILAHVRVAKSTLSLWLRAVPLAERQRQRLTEKRTLALLRGAHRRRTQRLDSTAALMKKAKSEIGTLTKHEKLIAGCLLYWTEGSKQREGNWGTGVIFSNSDPRMLRLFQLWLTQVVNIDRGRIKYEIYIHDTYSHKIFEVRKFWSLALSVPVESLATVYYKKHTLRTNRKNQGNAYYGLVRICVRSSSDLNRRISGWIEGVIENWGIV